MTGADGVSVMSVQLGQSVSYPPFVDLGEGRQRPAMLSAPSSLVPAMFVSRLSAVLQQNMSVIITKEY